MRAQFSKSEIARGTRMSPTTRQRKVQLEDYVPHVLEAVKLLANGEDQGASRQNIEKYLEETFNEETNEMIKLPSPVVKSAIRKALSSGLLTHASGVGLNGSFLIHQKGEDFLEANSCEKMKGFVTKEAKLRNISSLGSEYLQDTPPLKNTLKAAASNKRQRNSKLVVPFAEEEIVKNSQGKTAEKCTALKTILKSATTRKLAAKLKRKNGARKVKFCSPPKVIFISPCIKRMSKRKK